MLMEIPNNLLESQIDRGTILHSTMFENIDHGKFFVIIGVNTDYVAGFFFVNSNINNYIRDKQEQLDMQYPLKRADYDFLKYDSFLSATRIEKVPRSKIVETINTGITEFVGVMKQEHMDELLEKARGSILFSKQQIKQFLY